MSRLLPLAAILLAACGGSDETVTAESNLASPMAAQPEQVAPAAPEHAAPAAPVPTTQQADATSGEAATDVVRNYYALLGRGQFAEARALWSDSGNASGLSEEQFALSMTKYQNYAAEVGAPGLPEGAAGSIYVEVPVRVTGTVRGEPFALEGPVTLRRCNNVPGCTPDQLQWRIAKLGMEPQPAE